MREALSATYDPKYSAVGHGSWVETAKESLKTGMQAKVNHLGTTAIPLFDYSKTYEEQIDDVIQTLTHWPHYNLPAVVIIMIPNPEEGEPGGQRYFDSYFEELPGVDTGYNNRFVIPAQYVIGYVDVEQKVFIENPDFKPVKKTLPKSQPFTLPKRHADKSEIPRPTQDKEAKIDDVW